MPTRPTGPTRPTAPADPEDAAREVVLRQLSHGPRTRLQLATALRSRNVPEGAAEAALDRFTELGYIDDRAYADAWVRSRARSKGLSRRMLARELRTKGVEDQVIDGALEALPDGEEVEAARELAHRRARRMGALEPEVALRRLAGLLARKGHAPGLALRVAREVLVEVDGEHGGSHPPTAARRRGTSR